MSGATEVGHIYSTYTTMSKIVKTGRGRVWGITVSESSSAVTLKLYDNTSASGTVLWQAVFQLNTAGVSPISVDLHGVSFGTGCYLSISGGTVGVSVIYS